MLKKVILAENTIDPLTWETFEVEDVRDFLMERFDTFPETARIYNGNVGDDFDVTPNDEQSIERLGNLNGPFYVMVFPGDLVFSPFVAAYNWVKKRLSPAVPQIPTITLRNTQSESPNNGLSDRQNSVRIGARIPDIYGTVRSTPDLLSVPYKVYEDNVEVEYAYMCVGRGSYDVSDVRDGETPIGSIDDAIINVYGPDTSPNSGDAPQFGVPANTLIGEPVYSISKINAVNGQTLSAPNAGIIVGASNIKFRPEYGNSNIISPANISNSVKFSDIFTTFGESATITNAILTITPTGATTTSLSSYTVSAKYNTLQYGSGELVFATPSQALLFPANTLISLTSAIFNDGVNPPFDLNGIYCVYSSNGTTGEIELRYPRNINNNWVKVDTQYVGNQTENRSIFIQGTNAPIGVNLNGNYFVDKGFEDSSLRFVQNSFAPYDSSFGWTYVHACANEETQLFSPTITRSTTPWVGPFDIQREDTEQIWCNFVAINGLYKDDGTSQTSVNVEIELEITPINASGFAVGPAETFSTYVVGSSALRSLRAVTLKATPTFSGRCRIRARRVDDTDLAFNGQVSDEIKWKDAYAVYEIPNNAFGDVTTVHSKTIATEGALAVKSRKLNMLVTRKIPTRISGSTFTTALTATNKADEILSAICLDQYIGRRDVSEIDFDSIYDTMDAIETYFGTSKAVEFNYTFDSENLSFEETVNAVCDVIFCKAYRQGSQIKINFEKETADSVLLFNHRNKIPGSEVRNIRFGTENQHDGIELEYVDPTDDSIQTFYIPTNKSAVNPKKIQTIGIRNKLQAYFHAYRAWNKIQYQNISSQFEATQEADLLVIGDRILVADNTRPDIQDGEVLSQNGLELTLSQDVNLTVHPSYQIFLQHVDGTVEALGITAGTAANKVVLAGAPKAALALDPELYATTTYLIVGSTEKAFSAFLVAEKDSQENFTSVVNAVNYDSRYYQNDDDYIDNIVDINGNLI